MILELVDMARAGDWAGIVLDVALKGTALLLAALVVHALIGRQRHVLTRSAMWNAMLVALVVLPLVAIAFPRLRVPCLPPMPKNLRGGGALSPDLDTTSGPVRTTSGTRAAPASPCPVPAGAAAALPRENPDGGGPFPWLWLAVITYAGGACVLLVRLAGGLYLLRGVRRGARPLASIAWQRHVEAASRAIGLDVPVTVAVSDMVNVPVAIGWRRPMVLIPDHIVQNIAPRDRYAILLHEMAHVRRRDFAWQVLHQFVCAVYWPHPLVWLVGGVISAVRERVCDEICVHLIGDVASYQNTLIDVAGRIVNRPRLAAGIAMARSSRLRDRLRSIEDTPGVTHCAAGWRTRLAWVALTVFCTGTIGAVELTAQQRSHPGTDRPAAAIDWTARLHIPGDEDPCFYKPDKLAGLYFAALAEANTALLERLTSGRLAQRNPAEWAALAERLAKDCGLPQWTSLALEHATRDEYTAVRRAGPSTGHTDLVLIMRECPTTCYSVVAVSEAPAGERLLDVLERGVKWFTHELDRDTPEHWVNLPELRP